MPRVGYLKPPRGGKSLEAKLADAEKRIRELEGREQVHKALLHRIRPGYDQYGSPVLKIIGPHAGGAPPEKTIELLPRGRAAGLLLAWQEDVWAANVAHDLLDDEADGAGPEAIAETITAKLRAAYPDAARGNEIAAMRVCEVIGRVIVKVLEPMTQNRSRTALEIATRHILRKAGVGTERSIPGPTST